MANPNSEIWGSPTSWVYSELAYGIEGAGARFAGYAKPMTSNFGDGSTQGYRGSLLRAINVTHKMTLNEKLDRSICPCGQAPDVSPWGKVAIFNENNDISTTPSRIVTDTNNINWFLCDRNMAGNNARYYSKVYNNGNNGGLAFQQFSPRAYSPASSANTCMRLTPYVYYGLRSFVATIQVHLAPKNATEVIVNTIWTNLGDWINYKDTHDLIGIRLFFRNCTALNASTLVLTYNTDTSQYGGQYSNQIAVIQDFTVNNNGSDVETEFLSLNMESGVTYRSGYIFDICNVQNYPSGDNRRTNGVLPCWEYFDGQEVKRWKSSDNYDATFWYTIPYSQANYDKIMKIAALFGCFFTPTNKYTFNYDMLDNDLYLPILDENGVAHGQYTRGADNANNPLYTKNSIREVDYNPDSPPTPTDPNTYSNSSYFKFVALGSVANKRYALGVTDVNGLISDLWSLLTTFSQDSFDDFTQKVQAGFLVTNPIDSIVSLLCFPFTIPHNNDNVPIKLGKYDMTARGNTVSQSTYTINFTGVPIFPRFGNCYLDYEPYTNYEVYIPFCGTVPLKAADIIGHTLNVKLIVDLYTGSCTGYILADDLVIETVTGTVAITIPITGMDSSTINSQIVNANLNYKSSQYSAGAAIGSMVSVSGFISALSNPAEAVNKIAQSQISEERAQYELTHIPTQPHIIGASSPALGWCCDTIARVMIYYPTGDVITNDKPPSLIDEKISSFGSLNGFSCLKWGKVREFSGFTLGNIKLDGVPCTESERARLKQLFSTGVYL